MKLRIFLVLCCTVFWAAGVRADPITKIAVLPLVPLDGLVELRSGETLRDLLAAEFNRQSFGQGEAEAVLIMPDLASQSALETGHRAIEAARKHTETRSIDAAIASLNEAIVAFEAGGTAAQIAEVYSAQALALFQRGRDDEAEAALRQSLLLSPDMLLPEEKTSPVFSRKAQALRAQIAEAARSSLSIDSIPAGARIEVDGRSLGSAPLLVQDLAPGRHVVRALMPSSRQTLVQVVEISKAADAHVRFRLPHVNPLATLLDRLAENRVDAQVIDAALKLGFSHVLGGVLSADGQGNVRLDAFVLDVEARQLYSPAPVTFDRDLLSAGIELSKWVRTLLMPGRDPGVGIKTLPIALRPDGLPMVMRTEVRFGPLKPALSTPGTSKAQPASRRPIDARKSSGKLNPRER